MTTPTLDRFCWRARKRVTQTVGAKCPECGHPAGHGATTALACSQCEGSGVLQAESVGSHECWACGGRGTAEAQTAEAEKVAVRDLVDGVADALAASPDYEDTLAQFAFLTDPRTKALCDIADVCGTGYVDPQGVVADVRKALEMATRPPERPAADADVGDVTLGALIEAEMLAALREIAEACGVPYRGATRLPADVRKALEMSTETATSIAVDATKLWAEDMCARARRQERERAFREVVALAVRFAALADARAAHGVNALPQREAETETRALAVRILRGEP